jgi:replicative DNA helicase
MERKRVDVDYIDSMYSMVPPQATEVEEIVLAALILESDAITKVDLVPEVFYKHEHQVIFRAIYQLNEDGKNIDLITVTQKLKEQNQLNDLGGPGEITKLTRNVASAAHLEHHVRILLQYFVRRELIRVSTQVLQCSYDTSIDLSDIMDIYDKAVTDIDRVLMGKYSGRELRIILKDLRIEITRRAELSKIGGLTGVSTGFGVLNKYTSGWQPGWLVILASRPGMGKTAIAINRFAKEAARTGKWVNIFSLEMEDISLAERLVIGSSGINTYDFKNGKLTDEDWERYNEAEAELEKLPVYIDDSPYVKVSHIRNVARTNKRKNMCDLIIIDYLQLADAGDNLKNRNREQEISDITRRLKALAKELKVPIILLSQLSRKVEERASKRPILSDLRESGSIEQDADLVIFPFRPGYYESLNGENVSSNEGVLILAKNRHGKTGDIVFWYNSTMTDFSDEEFDSEPHEYDPEGFTTSRSEKINPF